MNTRPPPPIDAAANHYIDRFRSHFTDQIIYYKPTIFGPSGFGGGAGFYISGSWPVIPHISFQGRPTIRLATNRVILRKQEPLPGVHHPPSERFWFSLDKIAEASSNCNAN